MDIRIATRKSALALWQAEHVAAALRELPEVTSVDLVPLTTRGDEVLDRSLQKIGGKGLFIKELEIAMQNGDADIAVHSMKDVPADMPAGFCIAAVMQRANYADALVGPTNTTIDTLDNGARVGSSSLRRAAQLKMLRPDIVIAPLRGNVNTRLAKLDNGDYDAIVLAAAGLERLGLQGYISQQFSADEMLPAAAQGVVGIECLTNNAALQAILKKLQHDATALTTLAERAIARHLQASCHSPVAAHALLDGEHMTATALVALPDGSRSIRRKISGPAAAAERLGQNLAEELLEAGAGEILAATAAADGSADE
ncbi:hydroxymethylbilane synthase [Gammaproteobacteria bacterium]|jgi:hydroxymethylbilane synthase|nr:hydroxymethylbilane synthase [Gammaproteobacteria bacterium]